MTQRFSLVRLSLSLIFVGMLVVGMMGTVLAEDSIRSEPHALIMQVDGVINSVNGRFVSRAIEQSEEDKAALLIIELDTPGGLLGSTREIVQLLLESPIPIAVFVSPKGARAGSAGTFITAAGNLAVMAPGTNIGAAAPISSNGGDLEDTLASKVENDAAALIRSIAQTRGRNQDKLEATVRSAASYSAQEALADNVVDLIAENVDELLSKLDGLSVHTSLGTVVLETNGLEIRSFKKSILEHFLEVISDPNVSFLLLMVGGLGIVVEIFNPGLVGPGVIGVICLLLAFLALGNLPVNWAGVVFILLAVVLIVLEIAVSGFGILGVGATVSLIVGGFLLFNQFGDISPYQPFFNVNRWLLYGSSGVVGVAMTYVGLSSYQLRREVSPEKSRSLIGMQATVTAELSPRGIVLVGNETWTAISDDGRVITTGESVEVQSEDGLILTVSLLVNPE
ncbi:MAG: nodulation protein NfeD [Chloroflexota bacterium]|nr:nodulation protein NfeD [Chloroflexota bacterium]